VGTWEEIVLQMKDDAGEWADGSLEQYMAASARRGRKQTGVAIPATDPESFLRGQRGRGSNPNTALGRFPGLSAPVLQLHRDGQRPIAQREQGDRAREQQALELEIAAPRHLNGED